jgi:hypothetical protein
MGGLEAIRHIIRSGTNPLGEPPAVMFRASDWLRTGGFDASLPYAVDLDYWLRLLQWGDLVYLTDPLCAFRVSARSWSFQLAHRQSAQFCALANRWRVKSPAVVSAMDVWRGCGRSRVHQAARQVLYSVLRFGKRQADGEAAV